MLYRNCSSPLFSYYYHHQHHGFRKLDIAVWKTDSFSFTTTKPLLLESLEETRERKPITAHAIHTICFSVCLFFCYYTCILHNIFRIIIIYYDTAWNSIFTKHDTHSHTRLSLNAKPILIVPSQLPASIFLFVSHSNHYYWQKVRLTTEPNAYI